MWHLKELELINFMTYEHTKFRFLDGKALMVFGENRSDEGAKSNGSGKSGVLEGISVALLNECLRKGSTKDLVRDGESDSMQRLVLVNDILDSRLEIKREVFSNTKSGTLEILVNGKEPEKDLPGVNDGNNYILELIGITRLDLLNYFLISKEKYESFLNISDTKKKEIISRFSQSNLIDPFFIEVDQRIEDKIEDISDAEEEIRVKQGKIEVYQREVSNFSLTEVEEQRKRKIAGLKQQIEDNKTLSDQKTTEKLGLEEDRKLLDKELEEIEDIDYAKEIKEIEENIGKIRKKKTKSLVDYNILVETEAKIRKGLTDSVLCPSCDFEFSLSNKKLNIKIAKEKHGAIKQAITELEEYDKKLKDQIDIENKEIDSYDNLVSINKKSKTRLENEIEAIDQKISRIDNKIKLLIEDNVSITTSIGEITKKQIEDRSTEFKEKITTLNNEIEIENSKVKTFLEEKEEEQLLKETFIKFKSFLANKAIGAIEFAANEYLEKTKTNLSIQLDGYEMTRQKKLKEKISCSILRDGLSTGSFSRLSSGEKARVEIAIIMSLQSLINNSTEHGKGLDFTFLDEILESVDSEGISGIMRGLNLLEQTIMVITHATFETPYEYIATVIKENGASTIETTYE